VAVAEGVEVVEAGVDEPEMPTTSELRLDPRDNPVELDSDDGGGDV
jgi:hypothetical protein